MASENTVPAPRSAHLVVIPFPSAGHVIPALQFAEKLASDCGCIISFMCADSASIDSITKKRHGSQQLHPSVRLIAMSDEILTDLHQPPQNPVRRSPFSSVDLAPAFERAMNALIKECEGMSSPGTFPFCIISDFLLSWSQDTANKLGIPRYVFYPSLAAALAASLYLPSLVEQGLVPLLPHRQISIPGLPSPWDSSDLPISWQQDTPPELREFSLGNLLRLHESSGILINTSYDIEQTAIDAARSEILNPNRIPIHPIGPVLPSDIFYSEGRQELSQGENEYLLWLDKQAKSSVLYISFGSIYILSSGQIQEIAKALDSIQNQAFLWILKLPPSVTEGSVFPEGFRARTHTRGLISSAWAPQLAILNHPSTGGFLSHCGWNSTLESMCSGMPMLPLPQGAEQNMVRKVVVEEMKVGLKVERGEDGVAKSMEIERAVRALFEGEEGEEARRRAKGMREQGARAIREGGSSHKEMHSFVHALRIK